MYDLEGISKATSETQRNMELSESSRDYFNEVIPTQEEWMNLSETEKSESWQLIESRMKEICDLTGTREADVAYQLLVWHKAPVPRSSLHVQSARLCCRVLNESGSLPVQTNH